MRPAIQTCLCRSLRSNALDWADFRSRGGGVSSCCVHTDVPMDVPMGVAMIVGRPECPQYLGS